MTPSPLEGVAARPADLPVVDGILFPDLLPPHAAHALSKAVRNWREPYVGVTTDGTVADGLHELVDTGASSRDAVDAARRYLDALHPNERLVSHRPLDAAEWRLWTNALPTWAPGGMRLERLSEERRRLALALVEASLSPAGYQLVRDAMRLNGALGDLVGAYRDTLTEFGYWLTVFGNPDTGSAWGWQLMGHHLDLHCVFVGSQLVLAPVFIGAEPTFSLTGPHAGTRVLDQETERGLDLRRALLPEQQDAFLLGDSMLTADLPEEIAGPFDGRHLAGAGADNLVLPHEGIRGAELTPEQQDLLLALVRVYVDRMPRVHADLKLRQVEDHLSDTWFAWRGQHGDTSAFYYRIHSPVLLVEYDNHPGIFLDNPEPERFHVHTIVREPNGNDYGKALLAQHYARHHSAQGPHVRS